MAWNHGAGRWDELVDDRERVADDADQVAEHRERLADDADQVADGRDRLAEESGRGRGWNGRPFTVAGSMSATVFLCARTRGQRQRRGPAVRTTKKPNQIALVRLDYLPRWSTANCAQLYASINLIARLFSERLR